MLLLELTAPEIADDTYEGCNKSVPSKLKLKNGSLCIFLMFS